MTRSEITFRQLDDIARRFDSLPLNPAEENSSVSRMDRKFLVRTDKVPTLLAQVEGDYQGLDVGSVRLCRYVTTYFDTSDLSFYHAHHAGRLPRMKLRI